jgi:BMFP domain-containing protein YqiC
MIKMNKETVQRFMEILKPLLEEQVKRLETSVRKQFQEIFISLSEISDRLEYVEKFADATRPANLTLSNCEEIKSLHQIIESIRCDFNKLQTRVAELENKSADK